MQTYIRARELQRDQCASDPLFRQIPIASARGLLADIKKLPAGKEKNADKKYEEYVTRLLSSLLYPQLDFAEDQVRTVSGAQIRDLIFYNNRSVDFLADVFNQYESRQIVFELKNVGEIDRDHINQLNRYLNNEFGRFGFLLTRHPLTRAMFKNTIDLWAGQRRCIVNLDDSDLELMVNIFESKQRDPYEVLKKKYIEFTRACPS